ncbi:hypothetical protein WICPIJ_004747 [Wickerhamomyces pijperi]|uniref:Uncharacterized protein n=1 Tax=Wickerhamomyces pijperi TaxID=599730 RepID=A0A9P8Q4T8_WICPI|nr:hypothetical protein WICPIJ_004747 [Wickerhamomyces pijperi]
MSYLNRSNTGNSGNHAFNRPFSTNNPFRNASVDSSINDPNFQNWVNNNRVSQASFSSDEDEFDHFRVPAMPKPAFDRQLSVHSTGSNGSSSM